MTRRFLLFGWLFGVCAVACAPLSHGAEYGAKLAFKKGAPIQFPDFVLTYLGERHVTSPRYPRGFDIHDFRVTGGSATQTVSWSPGTGDIAPTLFQVGSKHFGLELDRSDRLGPFAVAEPDRSRPPWILSKPPVLPRP